MVLPVVLFFAALRLLRRPPSPESRGRLVIGWLCDDRRGARHRAGRRRTAPTREARRPRLRRADRLGRGHAADAPASARSSPSSCWPCWGSSGCWSPRPRRSTRSPSGCRSSTDRLLGRDDYDDEDYDDEEDDEPEERRRAAASAASRSRRTCSRPARSTTARWQAAAEATVVTEPEHTTLRAPLRPPVEDRTAPPEDLPPIDEPRAAHDPAGRGQLRAAVADHPAARAPRRGRDPRPTTSPSRRSPASSSSSTSTPPSPASPAGRRSPATRWSSAPRSRSRRSPR